MAGDKFYTEDELKKKSVAELKELAEAYIDEDEIDDIKTKQPLIAAIIDNQGAYVILPEVVAERVQL